jgi:hypothetical protein
MISKAGWGDGGGRYVGLHCLAGSVEAGETRWLEPRLSHIPPTQAHIYGW